MLGGVVGVVLPGSLVVEIKVTRKASDVVGGRIWGVESPDSLSRGTHHSAFWGNIFDVDLLKSSTAI